MYSEIGFALGGLKEAPIGLNTMPSEKVMIIWVSTETTWTPRPLHGAVYLPFTYIKFLQCYADLEG